MSTEDETTEQMLQAAGKTAPRVTREQIEAEIAIETYFTAADGATAAGAPYHDALSLLTFCVLVLRNGFTVIGESACASPENFDARIGRKVARDKAISQCWPLLGFRLRDRLCAETHAATPIDEPGQGPL